MFVRNQIIKWNLDSEGNSIRERVLWMDEGSDIVYLINIDDVTVPHTRNLREMERALMSGAATILMMDPFLRIVDEEQLLARSKEIRSRAWSMIQPLVGLEPDIYMAKRRGEIIRAVANEHQADRKTVLEYLKRYWVRGMTVNCLLPDFSQCGGKQVSASSASAKRGRPRLYGDTLGQGINVEDDAIRIFQTVINKYYYSGAKRSLTMTYELMRKEYYSDGFKIDKGIKMPMLKPSHQIPSFRQFRYWFEKQRDIKKEISSRYSSKKYEQEFRPVLGSSSMAVMGPGAVYLIDATIADLYVVSEINPSHIIGRPVLYIVQDCFSRMIVGCYVGLEGPSWLGAAMALLNAASDKGEFCRSTGLELEEGQWDVHCLPQSILADRGEMISKNAEGLIQNLGITISNTPPFRPEWKPLVERFFKLTNDQTKPFLPGVVNSDFMMKRLGKDYRLDAQLNLKQFTQILVKCILHHNNEYHLKSYNKDASFAIDGVEPIPKLLWEWGIANRMGKLRHVPEETVKYSLMPRGKGTVTASGIRVKGLYYSSKLSLKEQWFVKARAGRSWSVPVVYDPRNMDYIYVQLSETEFDKCYLLEHQTLYKGKRVEEVEFVMAWEKLQRSKTADGEMQAKAELMTEIEHIVDGAKRNTEQAMRETDESNSHRKKKIRDNRQAEKTMRRSNEAFELGQIRNDMSVEVIPLSSSIQNEESDPFALIRKVQKEEMNKNHG